MTEPTIALDEWLAEIERVNRERNDDGMSVRELAELTHHSQRWVRETLVQPSIAQGKIRLGFRHEKRIDGRNGIIPVYRFINI